MPTNYSGRVTLILSVLVIALIAIFPPASLFRSDLKFSEKIALKPGIDMVGGTSLLYEIKPPEGGLLSSNLAEQVMESLKKRVDPDGVMNLIWRPQGNTRLEIQMPASGKTGESAAKREAFAEAQRKLEATNVRSSQVIHAVEKLKGDEQARRLAELAMGSKTREKLFADLAKLHNEIVEAQQKQNAALQAEKELEYEKLKGEIDDTNLGAQSLEQSLAKRAETRDKVLAELRQRFADFPARTAAIDEFARKYDDYAQVKNNLDDATDLKRKLQGSGVLEFHILATDYASPEARAMIERLQKHGPGVQAGDTMRWYELEKKDELRGQTFAYNDKQWALAYTTPDKSMTNRAGLARWALQNAYLLSENAQRKVGFAFDAQGAKYFGDLTENNIHKQLAIMLDDKLISAPNINSRIGANGEITGGGEGGFSARDADYLISTLRAGSLPAQLAQEPISERTVGPQLGQDNLKRGLTACAIGLIIVFIFLIGYYYLAGVVASFAVLLNVVIILGVMAMFKATFTLPGIAGIVLTIGAAVDANVLIFERLREEQHRGLSLRMALRNAYDRAFSAIVDSNATTVCTSLFLYWFGSEEVKGFGLTLLIGLLSSLFTALFVTKTIFGIMIDKFHIDQLGSLPLTFPKWDRLLKPNIDWMKLVPIFATFSAVIVAVGCTAFVVKLRAREMADIEFASGTSVEFELKNPMRIEEVRKLIQSSKVSADLPSPSVQTVGTNDLQYEVVTPSDDVPKVRAAVLRAMGDLLKVELPSKFELADKSVDEALDKAVLPIKEGEVSINGWTPPGASAYTGGAAIVLKDLDPPLKPSEIKARIEHQRLQPAAQGGTAAYRDYTVEAETGPNNATKLAVVLTSDPNLPFEKDALKWKEEVAGPMWRLVNEAVNKPPQLQKVTSFNPQVAGDAQRDAYIALTLSLIVIMAYIWLRFGNLKYGAATVFAMLHDTLLVIGFLGLSHWMMQYTPWLAHALMVEPFRINLTIVAAILTVMSYSMIDTIVVFDRVRENRGKFGHLSRRIINDSINQTLSRTLLTGGTNVVTVLVMYILGGPGIHGFTFVLLAGILVGTYSSVAIAAPVLLIGAEKMPEPVRGSLGQLQQA